MTKSAFRFLLGLGLCLFGSGFALAAPVAYVHELTGNLQAQYGSRAPQSLKIGDTIESGAVLSTGDKSTAVVKFEDGQIVVLLPKTRFAVTNYRYNAKQVKDSNIAFQLLQGGLRFVTGMIGSTNHNAFKLTVGTATIGIRGSDVTTFYDAIANIVTVAVKEGAAELTNSLGSQTILAGDFSSATSNNAPTVAAVIERATAAIRDQVRQSFGVTIPANDPVVISAISAAVKAQAVAKAAAAAAAAAPGDQAAQEAAAIAQAAANAALQAALQAAVQATTNATATGGGLSNPKCPNGASTC